MCGKGPFRDPKLPRSSKFAFRELKVKIKVKEWSTL